MMSFLCNFLEDWGRSINRSIGDTGIIIVLVALFCLAALLFYGIIRTSLIVVSVKRTTKIAWGYIFLLIIVILLFVWFTTML